MNDETPAYVLRSNGMRFMDGSLSLLAVVFNRLMGAYDESPEDHRKYLAVMGPALTGKALEPGDRIEFIQHGQVTAEFKIGDPMGEKLTEAALFRTWMDRVEGEMGVDDVAPDGFLDSFRSGMSPADAVLKDRLVAGVMETQPVAAHT